MKIKVNHVELFYEMSGAGEPLLLLHGNGEDHHIFDEISKRLRESFTVYAIDSRNHGESEKTKDYSYETMAADIYILIKELHLDQVNIVGFSDGAIISLMLAMNHSGAIGKMALLGVNLKPEDFTAESYQFVKETYEEAKDPLFKLMLEQPNIELEEVKDVNVPTLLVAGEHDVFRHGLYEQLVDTLPDAKLKIMKDHDHDSYIAGRDILYEELYEFFR